MKTIRFHPWLALVLLLVSTLAVPAAMPKAGDPAPPFAGHDQDGKTVKLSRFLGRKIVLLYFYPRDDTPGCTKEACGFRDSLADLAKSKVEVIGVSFDSADSHQQFIAKYKLNFPLLADTDGKIADAYGVRAAGKTVDRRVSFLIGLDGKLIRVVDAGNPDVQLQDMKAAIAGLKKP